MQLIRNERCPMCGEDFAPNRIGRIRECEYQTVEDEFEVHQCRGCETVMMDPRPTESSFPIIYPDDYYAYKLDEEDSTEREGFVQKLFYEVLKRSKEQCMLAHVTIPTDRPLRVLDIGCGIGSQLDFLKKMYPDAETWGCDFSEAAIARVNRNGHNGVLGRFEEQDFPEGHFDLILSMHVVEHVGEPDAFVREAARLLNPAGVLVLATPNIDSWDFKLLKGRHWGGYHTPRHWYLYSRRSFEALAARLRLKVVGFRPYTLSSFWVVSCNSIARDALGKKFADAVFPGVGVLKGGLYSFFLLSFFAAFERGLLAVTGKGNAMWITLQRGEA